MSLKEKLTNKRKTQSNKPKAFTSSDIELVKNVFISSMQGQLSDFFCFGWGG